MKRIKFKIWGQWRDDSYRLQLVPVKITGYLFENKLYPEFPIVVHKPIKHRGDGVFRQYDELGCWDASDYVTGWGYPSVNSKTIKEALSQAESKITIAGVDAFKKVVRQIIDEKGVLNELYSLV